MTTRGIRNNNPGNIRHGDKWQGLSDQQPDASFCTFTDPVWGIRAIVRILIQYEKAGKNTVAAIISRWAPPVENNTTAYINAVASAVGVGAGELIDVDTFGVMFPMVKAIITHENGANPYPDDMIRKALRLAGVPDTPQTPLTKKLATKALTGAGIGLGLVSQVAEPARHVADGLGGLIGSPLMQRIVTVALTIAGIGTLAMMAKTWVDHKRGL